MLLAVLDFAAFMALISTHPIAAGIVAVVLLIAGIRNKDKIQAGLVSAKDFVTGKATDATGDVKGGVENVNAKVEDFFKGVAGKITDAKDDVHAALMDLRIRALHNDFVVADPTDAPQIEAAFQALMNANAKLKTVTTPTVTTV